MLSGFRDWIAEQNVEMPELHAGMTNQALFDHFNYESEYNESNKELFTRQEIGWKYIQPLAQKYQDNYESGDDEEFFLHYRAIYYSKDNSRNESGEDEIYFFSAVNVDFGYGRDSRSWLKCYGANPNQHRNEYSRNVLLSELTPELVKTIADEMLENFKNS
jgi:hypothetical protein